MRSTATGSAPASRTARPPACPRRSPSTATACAAGTSGHGCRSDRRRACRSSWATDRAAPTHRGPPRSGLAFTCDRERHLLSLRTRLDLPDAGAVEQRPGDVDARGPSAARRGRTRASAPATTCPPFLRNRTVTDGPLAYWMPLAVLCESANTSRCGCGDAARSTAEHEREEGLGVGRGAVAGPRDVGERAGDDEPAGRPERATEERTARARAGREGCGGHPPILPARERNWASGAVLVQRRPGRGRRRARASRCSRCSASGSASCRRRTGARHRASADAARCWSTASARVACVTPATRVAGRAVTDRRGSRRRGARRPRGALRGDRRLAVRVLHAGDPRARWRPPRRRARPGGSTSTAPSPRTCAAAPAGRRSTRPIEGSAHAGRRHAIRGAAAASGRARRRRVASAWAPACRSATAGFADDGAPRDALVAVPLPPGSTATAVRGRGQCVGRRRVAARGAGARGQGAGPAHDGRSGTAARAPCAGDRRRAARHGVGRARVPRARRVVVRAGRRARRRRSPTAARSAARSHRRCGVAARELADRTGRAVRVVYSREDVVRLGPKRPPIAADRVLRRRDRARARRRRRRHRCVRRADRVAVRDRGRRRLDERDRSPARRPRRRCAPRVWPSEPCCSKARCTSPVSTARSLVRDDRAASVLLDTCVAADERRRSPVRASRSRRLGAHRARARARRRGRSARRGRAPLLRDRRRAHGAGLGAHRRARRRPRHRRGARPHHPLVRDPARQGHAADRRRDRRRSGRTAALARPTRCSRPSPRPRGTRSATPRARARRRSPPARRAPRPRYAVETGAAPPR